MASDFCLTSKTIMHDVLRERSVEVSRKLRLLIENNGLAKQAFHQFCYNIAPYFAEMINNTKDEHNDN